MMEKIFLADVNGTRSLCFDTGLSGADFARAGFSKLMEARGFVVGTDGSITIWKCEGTAELHETISLWGAPIGESSAFSGTAFTELISDDMKKDAALDALRRWVSARAALDNAGHDDAALAPGGTFLMADGSIFFPSEVLIDRCLYAENSIMDKKERFIHPDLKGKAAVVCTLACMAYRVFCGSDAFQSDEETTLHQDMREGVFIPPRFAATGMDKRFDSLIGKTFSRFYEDHPPLDTWAEFLGAPGSIPFAKYFHEISTEEAETIQHEKEKFVKKKERRVKTRRFIKKHAAIILGISAAVIIAGSIVGSIIYDRAQRPTTKGMTPSEVVRAYYDAFNSVDHVFMDQIAIDGAGKRDIDMAMHLFVLVKVREAYQHEMRSSAIFPAQDWLEDGADPVPADIIVFGITDFTSVPEDEDAEDGEVSFNVTYTLWTPVFTGDEMPIDEIPPPRLPESQSYIDDVRLILHKGAWRIAGITRNES